VSEDGSIQVLDGNPDSRFRGIPFAVVNQLVSRRFAARVVLDPAVKVSLGTKGVLPLQPAGNGLRHVVRPGVID